MLITAKRLDYAYRHKPDANVRLLIPACKSSISYLEYLLVVLLAELIRGKEGSQPGPASIKDDVPVSPIIGVRTDIIECIAHVSAVCTNTVKAGLRKPTATFQIHTEKKLSAFKSRFCVWSKLSSYVSYCSFVRTPILKLSIISNDSSQSDNAELP